MANLKQTQRIKWALTHSYKTDELGRVKSVSGKLELNKVDRNTYQQSKAGKTDGIKDGLVDDEGGHLIAS
ncbi:TPA: DNA/RNA non-specific endonuclease, partial [Vibrio vulnificus]